MEELRFSIDEEKYDDRRGQVLSLSGWYAAPGTGSMFFLLLGDGREKIPLPETERRPRPDVVQALDLETGDFLPGFTVRIAEPGNWRKKFGVLELFLEGEGQKVPVWKKDRDGLKEFLRQSLLEYQIDRAEVLYDTMVEIQGWAVDQRGYAQIEFLRGTEALFRAE